MNPAHPESAPPDRPCWVTIGTDGAGSCERLVEKIHCRNCPVFSEGGRALLDQAAPPGYLEEWTALLAREKEETPADSLSAVVFRLAGSRFAVKASTLVNVGVARGIRRVPHRTSAVFRGLTNVDGELLLCADAGPVLAPGAAHGPDSLFILVLRNERGERWAMPVDAVEGLVRAPRRSDDRLDTDGGPVPLVEESRLFDAFDRQLNP
jgi:chemotaxis-related protein WspD